MVCPARVMHRAAPIARGDLVAQVRQRDVCAEPLDQCRFRVSPSAPTLLAGGPNEVAGMFAEGERAVHGLKDMLLVELLGGRVPALAETHNLQALLAPP